MEIIRAGVPEDKRSYSSVKSDDEIGTGYARSTIDSAKAWSAKTKKEGEWIQLDLGQEEVVIGTAIQGRVDSDQYVLEYTVSTSVDGTEWVEVPGVYNGDLRDIITENLFSDSTSVYARYVRLIVKSWNKNISLRADVLIVGGTGTPASII